jgi:hypothetical protein
MRVNTSSFRLCQTLSDWDADWLKDTAARMEQFSVHALLAQLDVPSLVSEGEVPPPSGVEGFGWPGRGLRSSSEEVRPPVWMGKAFPLQRQPAGSGAAPGAVGGRGAAGVGGDPWPCWTVIWRA